MGILDAPYESASPEFSMGAGYSEPFLYQDKGPGPGAHDVSSRADCGGKGKTPGEFYGGGPAYSIQGKYGDERPNDTPGPGAYNQYDDPSHARSASYSLGPALGRGEADASVSLVPGPGAYNVPAGGLQQVCGRTSPSYSMGVADRGQQQSNDFPGPGAYSVDAGHEAIAPRPAAYSLGGPMSERVAYNPSISPGPVYDVDRGAAVVNPSAPAFSIGMANRNDALEPSNTPGPASYNPRIGAAAHTSPAYLMRVPSHRAAPTRSDAAPGPGAYSPKLPNGGTSHSISAVHASAEADETPGPGAYHPMRAMGMAYSSSPRYSVQGRTRSPETTAGADTPGPGTYDHVADKPHTASSPKFSMGAKQKEVANSAASTPGPAAYGVPPEKPDKLKPPAYSMGRPSIAGPKRPAPQSPGPGAYRWQDNTFKQQRAPAYSMGPMPRRAAPKLPKDSTPGPGSYSPGAFRTRPPAYSMGVPRASTASFARGQTPGPGAYGYGYARSGSGKHRAPAFSMGGAPTRSPGKVVSDSCPGPGTYDHERRAREGTAYSMGGLLHTPEPVAGADGPGPGHYTPGQPQGTTSPTWKLHTSPRKFANDRAGNNVPGPGSHDPAVEPTVRSPSFSMAARHRAAPIAISPGPGDTTRKMTRRGDRELAEASIEFARRNPSDPKPPYSAWA